MFPDDAIWKSCLALTATSLPQSALGKACRYTLNMWEKLVRCLEHEQVELSNNLAENSMRPVAVGRNYAQSMIMCSPPLALAA